MITICYMEMEINQLGEESTHGREFQSIRKRKNSHSYTQYKSNLNQESNLNRIKQPYEFPRTVTKKRSGKETVSIS